MLVACSEDTTSETKEEAPVEVKEDAAPKQMKKFNLEELEACKRSCIGSITCESLKSLNNAGLASDLAGLVAADRNISMDVENKDNLAVKQVLYWQT